MEAKAEVSHPMMKIQWCVNKMVLRPESYNGYRTRLDQRCLFGSSTSFANIRYEREKIKERDRYEETVNERIM